MTINSARSRYWPNAIAAALSLVLAACDQPPTERQPDSELEKIHANLDRFERELEEKKLAAAPEISPHIESKPIEPTAAAKATAIPEQKFCAALGKALRASDREFARAMIVRASELNFGGLKFAQQAAIRKHEISLGMTPCMAVAAWGRPEDINSSVGSYGRHEQWVYNGTYLYFENDTLTSWQD